MLQLQRVSAATPRHPTHAMLVAAAAAGTVATSAWVAGAGLLAACIEPWGGHHTSDVHPRLTSDAAAAVVELDRCGMCARDMHAGYFAEAHADGAAHAARADAAPGQTSLVVDNRCPAPAAPPAEHRACACRNVPHPWQGHTAHDSRGTAGSPVRDRPVSPAAHPRSPGGSPLGGGASGKAVLLADDGRFVVKEMGLWELRQFTCLMPSLRAHLRARPSSFLPRYHRVVLVGGAALDTNGRGGALVEWAVGGAFWWLLWPAFLWPWGRWRACAVMEAVWHGGADGGGVQPASRHGMRSPIDTLYDIKGINPRRVYRGRYVHTLPGHHQHRGGGTARVPGAGAARPPPRTLKDLNWLEDGHMVACPPAELAAAMATLEADTAFLRDHGIYDYSLLAAARPIPRLLSICRFCLAAFLLASAGNQRGVPAAAERLAWGRARCPPLVLARLTGVWVPRACGCPRPCSAPPLDP